MGRAVVADLLIQRTVGDAIATDGVIWASTSARQMKETFPGCALREPTPGEILMDTDNTSRDAAGRCAS